MRLTTAQRNRLPNSAFAIPELRWGPLPDAKHVHAAGSRLEHEHNVGRITGSQYARAKKRIASAARRFGTTSLYLNECDYSTECETENPLSSGAMWGIGLAVAGGIGLAIYYATRPAASSTGVSGIHTGLGPKGDGIAGIGDQGAPLSEMTKNELGVGHGGGNLEGVGVGSPMSQLIAAYNALIALGPNICAYAYQPQLVEFQQAFSTAYGAIPISGQYDESTQDAMYAMAQQLGLPTPVSCGDSFVINGLLQTGPVPPAPPQEPHRPRPQPPRHPQPTPTPQPPHKSR